MEERLEGLEKAASISLEQYELLVNASLLAASSGIKLIYTEQNHNILWSMSRELMWRRGGWGVGEMRCCPKGNRFSEIQRVM